MRESDRPAGAARYLQRVDALLSNIHEEERRSVLSELADLLKDVPEREMVGRLGTPEEFASEFLESAGVGIPPHMTSVSRIPMVARVLSVAALPFGVLALLSFGAQLVYGPFVVGIEWILARVSSTRVRILWSLLAGALAGETLFVAWPFRSPRAEVLAATVSLVTAALVTVLVNRTARDNAAQTLQRAVPTIVS